ncbi:MAG: hypothetical protein HW401_543 [Parcubacteria group bacterium]|nr:hypothetical protein [Parcubacteria group bacterium]
MFNFFKTKKEERVKNKFMGRHQQLCSVKKFLGEEVPTLELQIATNKDISERDEIIKKLEEVEKYISSDMFTNRLDVESVNKDMQDLIREGYKNCVLTNDTALENRCLKILDDTIKYMQNFARKNPNLNGEEVANQLDSIMALTTTGETVSFITLGGLLNDDQQVAWAIMNSLFYSNKLIRVASSLLPPEPSQEQAQKIKRFAEKLLNEEKININNLQKIEEEIKEGLLLNKEFYK